MESKAAVAVLVLNTDRQTHSRSHSGLQLADTELCWGDYMAPLLEARCCKADSGDLKLSL